MLIWRSQRPSNISKFVENNSPSSVRGTPGDTWRKYLQDQGATGSTMYDLEQSYLRLQGEQTWDQHVDTLGYRIGVVWDRVRTWLASILGGGGPATNGTPIGLLLSLTREP